MLLRTSAWHRADYAHMTQIWMSNGRWRRRALARSRIVRFTHIRSFKSALVPGSSTQPLNVYAMCLPCRALERRLLEDTPHFFISHNCIHWLKLASRKGFFFKTHFADTIARLWCVVHCDALTCLDEKSHILVSRRWSNRRQNRRISLLFCGRATFNKLRNYTRFAAHAT